MLVVIMIGGLMRHLVIAAAAACVTVSAIGVRAQGFTPQELDRMSQERLSNGDFRKFAAPPAPPKTTAPETIRPVQGLWVCMSVTPYIPILSEPRSGAPSIGQAADPIAAGPDRDGYTSILYHEGRIGWVPTKDVKPYHNEFDPKATCRVAGFRSSGMVTFHVR